MPVYAISKKTLKNAYGISYPTLRKWLSKVPGLPAHVLDSHIRNLTPKEVEMIYSHLGRPEGY